AAALVGVQTGLLVFLHPLYLVERGALGPEAVGYLVGLGALGRLLGLWLGASMSDRWGRMRVMLPGLLGYGALLGSLTLVRHPFWLAVWTFAIGGGAGFVATIPTAVVGDRVGPPLQGIAIGCLRTAADGGFVLGPLLFGALADAAHLSAPFLAGAALLAASAWGCRREARRPAPGP
ncbi:MAG TPA: MFS transporter, partial [Methylomirabilota bacterium]|nr:MFS transporter [Methylomirabilota bacterium]